MNGVRVHCRTLLTRRDESRSLHEARQGLRMNVWVTVNHSSKKRRNRYLCSFPTRGEQITKCDSDRQVAWTNTQCTVNTEKQNVIIQVDE